MLFEALYNTILWLPVHSVYWILSNSSLCNCKKMRKLLALSYVAPMNSIYIHTSYGFVKVFSISYSLIPLLYLIHFSIKLISQSSTVILLTYVPLMESNAFFMMSENCLFTQSTKCIQKAQQKNLLSPYFFRSLQEHEGRESFFGEVSRGKRRCWLVHPLLSHTHYSTHCIYTQQNTRPSLHPLVWHHFKSRLD